MPHENATTTAQTPAETTIDPAAVLEQVKAGIEAADAPAPGEPAKPADPPEGADPLEKPAATPDPDKPAGEEGKPPEAEEAAENPAKPVATEEEPKPKRPSDEFGELDDRVSDRTRERFEKLRNGYDELHARATEAEARAQQWVDGVSATGATPDQFAASLRYLDLVNRGDRTSLEQAREMMKTEYEHLSKSLGYPVDNHDPLEAHPDLKKRVDEDGLDRDVALELARRRAGDKIDAASTQARNTAEQERQQRAEAIDGLKALTEEMRARNPAVFTYKAATLKPAIDEIARHYPPSEWVARVRAAYLQVPDPPMAAAPAAAGGAAPTPLRATGSGGANGLQREPQSALEAVQMGMQKQGWG